MKRSASSRLARIACFACLVLAASGVGQAATAPRAVSVFAAASLADAFAEIARSFERAHPGVHVRLNLAGSQQLEAQLEQGAAADVFASADERWMTTAREHSLVAGEPQVFARNRLVAIVPRTNPARIGRLQDLARPGVKLVLGADAVPVGRYAREVLQNLSRATGFDPGYAKRALANLVSEEENVKSVVAKVQLGEADAGFCYRSDISPAVARFVRAIPIPDSANVVASYPIALVAGAAEPESAREFIALVLSPAGQQVLARRGLTPLGPPGR
jgi:molybdate transport system substrate-binding protein